MKWFWTALLVISSLSLLVVLFRNRGSLEFLRRFALHLILAALALYAVNYSGLLSGWEIPLNATTVGTVMVLGLPGVALIAGLKAVLF
ncbi:pro-sigmaK processing inhibitor BofA family protein [Paenibacillus sp. PR3]|uniref:Pro-sigmaK processing inhibitor BofA family protein n=1 Tax=Paenibacillus terricola TaxID=2763503 RepID=A0ABR8N2N0_9BACL|nr:pro-sigmaK processing inhibitor BofA family protein [Paenibacillus terricola]MBD3921796.1 pro-sigmaK processing inhibitor BofA family protein [Paenibacillus terricola]